MKKWLKRMAALAAAATMCLSLAACGGGNDTPSGTGNVDGQGGGEKTQVTFWHVYSENFGATLIDEMIQEFNGMQDEIEVVGVYNADMYPGLMTNLQAEVASGDYPSICMIGYNYLNYFAGNFDYVDIKSFDSEGWLDATFLPNILSLAQVDGVQLGVPMSISTPILYYNADIFEEAGLTDPPETWDQVKEYAKQIKDTTGKYGFYMQEYADNWAIQGLLESNGASMLTDGAASFASQESAEAYQILADMVITDGSALHVAADEGIAAFSSGQVGMLLGTSAKIGTITDSASFTLKAAPFPGFEGKDKRLPAGGNFLAITAQDEAEQVAALEFIKFVMEPDNLAKWSAGMGYLPPREDVSTALSEELEGGTVAELWQVAFSEMPDIYSWVSYPGDIGTYAEQLLADTRDSILGGADPMEALQSAQDSLNQRLGK